MYCRNCGKELAADSKFCSGCGQSVSATGNQAENIPLVVQPYVKVIPYPDEITKKGR
jgi:uncharacterized membrane protein YvbJ